MKKLGKKPLKWFKMKIDRKIIEQLRVANVARCMIELSENNESIISITYRLQATSNKNVRLQATSNKNVRRQATDKLQAK